ncbi:MAG: hypothetical protein DI598_06800 [Pseudopedobacter saltans]|uniref:Uncharacterized protein n=1 Tax=Pseudopedobacter saltans TaxID=151895 RepID=A0A2W5F110_9SPHI|nr:MAG: hypothetical protein DI598_06800 [Pseudopedobacter saltans]
MKSLLFILFVLICIIVVLGIPTIAMIWLYKKMRKTKYGKFAFLVPTLVLVFGLSEIYFAVFPNESFYKEDFETLSNMKFPEGAILYKTTDFPDIHGHYASVVVMELNKENYNKLLKKVSETKAFKLCNILYDTRIFTRKGFNEQYIKTQYYKGKLLLSFFKDGKTVVVQRGISEFEYAEKAYSLRTK